MKTPKGIQLGFAALSALAFAFGVVNLPAASAAGPPRIDLGVLVVTDGTPWVEAIHQQLTAEGVPTTVVDLNNTARSTITGTYLAGTLADGTPEAHYQGVVLPNDAPAGLSADEMAALSSYEGTFGVRQVDGYLYPTANVGMNPPTYAGSLDGDTVTATNDAKAAGFGYLNGTFNFEGKPGGGLSYGYLGQPLANTATTTFTSFLTAPIPGGTGSGTLAGVYKNGSREQLEISFGYSYYQLQYRYISHGIVDWLTRGVHFGYWRNWFDVHIDDVFNADAIWSDSGKCTPGDGTCPAGTPDTTPARMTDADVMNAVQWEQQNKFTLDMLYNGGAEAQFQTGGGGLLGGLLGGGDPTFDAFQLNANNFRWVNHTFTHQFLGCVQDFTVIPWRCQTDANGNIVWVDSATINDEINKNVQWANQNGFPINRGELTAGEHSGTMIMPQQPVDNPNFDNAMGPDKIQVTGLDASREPALRPVGAAMGAPRHPINVFYNVSTQAEEVSEYNWIYTSKANGGSGICETTPGTSCIAPLDPSTGWSSYILPQAVNITLGYVLQNDPRAFYMHQSNLTDDRLALPVISGVLSAYRGVYATSTPIVNGRFLTASQSLNQLQNWAKIANGGTVSGYVQGTTVTVTGPAGTQVPLTTPNQTKQQNGSAFGASYANERSAFMTLGSTATTLTLNSAPYPSTTAAAPAPKPAASPAVTSPSAVNASDAAPNTVVTPKYVTPKKSNK